MAKAKDEIVSYDNLNGMQKAAIVCIALGKDFYAHILSQIPETDVRELTTEVSRFQGVPKEVSEQIVREFNEYLRGAEWLAEGGPKYARDALSQALGVERAEHILREIAPELEETSLTRLKRVDPDNLVNILRGEHPQIVALALSHLPPKQTAVVLQKVEPELGEDILYRIGCMDKVQPEYLEIIERNLAEHAVLGLSKGMAAAGGAKAVAEVLNVTPTSMEKALIEAIGKKDPELAEAIKNLMFVFDDLILLDDRAIQKLISEVELKTLALALKKCSPDLKPKITNNMATRQAQALEEELDMLRRVRVRDVEEAQARIISQVRKLEEQGIIVIGGGSEDDGFID